MVTGKDFSEEFSKEMCKLTNDYRKGNSKEALDCNPIADEISWERCENYGAANADPAPTAFLPAFASARITLRLLEYCKKFAAVNQSS